MIHEAAPELETLWRAASRRPMLPPEERRRGPSLDRRRVEELLPHREPLLLVHRITWVDRERAMVACGYDLARATPLLVGHFPAEPVWPGMLQVEAIGQAGWCLVRLLDRQAPRRFLLTQILAAEFTRPVKPAGELEIVAQAVSDGLFTILVGQCLQDDAVCCAAALRGIEQENKG